jgi:hypothetical protein
MIIRSSLIAAALSVCLAGCGARGAQSAATAKLPEGLWDAHTHLTWWGPDALDSLDKYGIVGVRDAGSDALTLIRWRDEIAKGKRRGPLILFAGGQIDGPRDNAKWRSIVTTEAEVRRAVDSLADLGVSFIKTHNKISPPMFFAVLRYAKARGLRVAAHLPPSIPAWVAADSGVGSIEHMAESILMSPVAAGMQMDSMQQLADWWNSPQGDSMIVRLARSGVAVTPTLAAYQEFAREQGASEQAKAGRLRSLEAQKKLVLKFHRAGIPILAGSDFADKDWTVRPGSSLLEEIKLLEEAGLTPAEARAAASTNIITWLSRKP